MTMKTLSLCPTCYKKIPAEIAFRAGQAFMDKICDVHGPFTAVVEKSIQHVSNFYQYGTLGNNNVIIVHAHNGCNMSCPWCYYPMGEEKMMPFSYYDNLLFQYKGTHRLLFSGGEPTLRVDYFKFVQEAVEAGWDPASITNMLKLAEPEFFARTVGSSMFVQNGIYLYALSMQHPKNYSKEIFDRKMTALENIDRAGLKAMCVMFSISSLDELEWIRHFYNETKHLYVMIRIRTLFRNWKNKDGDQAARERIFLSDLHKEFLARFGDLQPVQSRMVELSNMYCLYMRMDNGMNVSLSAGPTVEELDYHLCTRPVLMLAMDGKCYPVPIAQIVNEGISLGWKDGFRVEGGSLCGS